MTQRTCSNTGEAQLNLWSFGSTDLGWNAASCGFNMFPGKADAAGTGTTL